MLRKEKGLFVLIDKAEKERAVLLSTRGDDTPEPQTPMEDRREPSILEYTNPGQDETDGGLGKSSETDLRRRNLQTQATI